MSDFDRAFDIVVGHEGGFTTDRDDPGNWTGGAVGQGELRGTMFGISAAAFPTLDIKAVTLDAARAIYQHLYWNRLGCDAMPSRLALLVFDAAVNNGVGGATKFLQAAIGAAQDGLYGTATAAMLARRLASWGVEQVCVEFQTRRLMFMVALPTWQHFGFGWARRLCLLLFQAAAIDTPASSHTD